VARPLPIDLGVIFCFFFFISFFYLFFFFIIIFFFGVCSYFWVIASIDLIVVFCVGDLLLEFWFRL
jgi:hypothetical protein